MKNKGAYTSDCQWRPMAGGPGRMAPKSRPEIGFKGASPVPISEPDWLGSSESEPAIPRAWNCHRVHKSATMPKIWEVGTSDLPDLWTYFRNYPTF